MQSQTYVPFVPRFGDGKPPARKPNDSTDGLLTSAFLGLGIFWRRASGRERRCDLVEQRLTSTFFLLATLSMQVIMFIMAGLATNFFHLAVHHAYDVMIH
jgi:hypothetical protein